MGQSKTLTLLPVRKKHFNYINLSQAYLPKEGVQRGQFPDPGQIYILTIKNTGRNYFSENICDRNTKYRSN